MTHSHQQGPVQHCWSAYWKTILPLLMEENVMGWMCWKKFNHKGRTNSLERASRGKVRGNKTFFSLITHVNTRWSWVQKDETTLPSLLQASSFNHGAERRGLAHTKARMRIEHPWEKTLARKKSYTERVEEAGGWVISPSTRANKTRQRLLPVTRHDCHRGTTLLKSESKERPERNPDISLSIDSLVKLV